MRKSAVVGITTTTIQCNGGTINVEIQRSIKASDGEALLLRFELDEDKESYAITGIDGDKSLLPAELVIPATYEGKPATSIGEYTERCTYIIKSLKK